MGKLKTVEDFQRIADALRNDDAEPWQYRVQSFGYCPRCKEVTQYNAEGGPEGAWEHCLKCNTTFGTGGHRSSLEYLTGNMVPAKYIPVVENLHSRETQEIYFPAALQERIEVLRVEAEKHEKSVRDARKDEATLLLLAASFGPRARGRME